MVYTAKVKGPYLNLVIMYIAGHVHRPKWEAEMYPIKATVIIGLKQCTICTVCLVRVVNYIAHLPNYVNSLI